MTEAWAVYDHHLRLAQACNVRAAVPDGMHQANTKQSSSGELLPPGVAAGVGAPPSSIPAVSYSRSRRPKNRSRELQDVVGLTGIPAPQSATSCAFFSISPFWSEG